MTDEPGELAALRDAFPGYRFRRRDIRGVPCYLAEARSKEAVCVDAPLAAARSPAVLADMLAAAAGRPVRLRPAAVAEAYRDRRLTVQQCAAMFGVSRTTIVKFLTAEEIALRRPGDGVDDQVVVSAYRDERLSLNDCAARFGSARAGWPRCWNGTAFPAVRWDARRGERDHRCVTGRGRAAGR